MDFYYYHLASSLALTGVTTIVLGIFVFRRKQHERVGSIFLLWCLSIAWWSLLELMLITRETDASALFWGRVMQAGDVFLPTLFLHFTVTFLHVALKTSVLRILYSCSIGFAALCFTPYMIPAASARTSVPYFIDPGPFYYVMLGYFAACVLFAQYLLLKRYREAFGQNRIKLGYFLFSSIVGFLGGCMNFLLVFDIEIPALYSYGTYAVPLFVVAP